jgi:branched-subunit amino acid transport protein
MFQKEEGGGSEYGTESSMVMEVMKYVEVSLLTALIRSHCLE